MPTMLAGARAYSPHRYFVERWRRRLRPSCWAAAWSVSAVLALALSAVERLASADVVGRGLLVPRRPIRAVVEHRSLGPGYHAARGRRRAPLNMKNSLRSSPGDPPSSAGAEAAGAPDCRLLGDRADKGRLPPFDISAGRPPISTWLRLTVPKNSAKDQVHASPMNPRQGEPSTGRRPTRRHARGEPAPPCVPGCGSSDAALARARPERTECRRPGPSWPRPTARRSGGLTSWSWARGAAVAGAASGLQGPLRGFGAEDAQAARAARPGAPSAAPGGVGQLSTTSWLR